MKEHFNAPAKGTPSLDTRFFFRDHCYHLQTFDGADGRVASFTLTCNTDTPANSLAVEKAAAMMSQGLPFGVTLKSYLETFAAKPGDKLHVARELSGRQHVAANLWGAALGIMITHYDKPGAQPAKPRPSFLRVIDGGMA